MVDKNKFKRGGLYALKYTAFAIGLMAELLYKGGELVYSGAIKLYSWSELKLFVPTPRVVNVPVRQLGLRTGQRVFVRIIKPSKPRKIEVQYVRGE